MSFVTAAFFLFVAVVFLLYFLVPLKHRWWVLLAASYVYFWINSEWLIAALVATTFISYFAARRIQAITEAGKAYLQGEGKALSAAEKKAFRSKNKTRTKRVLVLAILLVLLILVFLKYHNFFAGQGNQLLKLLKIPFRIPKHSLLLPLGISFYTLQAIAYVTDVYRGKSEADKNPFKFMLFMSFFPQIVQGPIARHHQLAEQLYEGHPFDPERLKSGLQLMLWGLMKKLIIADRLAIPVDQIFDHADQYHGLIVFLAAALYGMQVYADFSGGMDIARGISEVLGIKLELNFRQPYFSTSIEDFWRRWHITLGSFMRDYVFYPLSLSKAFGSLSKKTRKFLGSFIGKRLPSFLAMFAVYFLVGIWHGSSWKYIAYGLYNGIFIMMGILLTDVYKKVREKLGAGEDKPLFTGFQRIRTFILITIGRYFSRASGLKVALRMMAATTVEMNDLSFLTDGSLIKLGLDNANWILLLIFLLILLVVGILHERGVHIREEFAKQPRILRWIILWAAIAALVVFGIWGPAYSDAKFIYGEF